MPLFNTANLFTFSFPSINRGAAWVTAFLDWTKRKQITINGAAKTADLTDTFTSDNSTDQDATNISVDATTNFRWDFDIKNDSTNDASSIDFGSTVSDSKFVIDFDFVLSTLTDASGTTANFVVLSSLDSATDSQTNQDALGMRIQNGVTDAFGIVESDAQSLPAGSSANMTTAVPTTRTYYVRFIRESTTKFTVILYADSDRSEVIDTISATINDTITSLRYFKISNYSGGGGGTATQIGYIDNLKIYDGVTTVKNIPSQQTATFTDDYTGIVDETASDSKYPSSDETKLDINLANDEVDWTISNGVGYNEAMVHDLQDELGSGWYADDKWVFKAPVTIDNYTQGSSTAALRFWLGLSDSDQTVDPATSQSFIGVTWRLDNINELIRNVWANGSNLFTNEDSFTTSPSATTYYVEVIRNGNKFTTNLYSDSSYSILIESNETTSVTANNLRYIYFGARSDNSGSDHTLDGTVGTIEFWNNISELNPTTLTDFVLPIKIQGDADLQRKTAETLDSDFTVTTGWTSTNARCEVDTTLEAIEMQNDMSVTNYQVAYNLGTPLSNTVWRMDLDIEFDALTAAGSNWVHIGLSDEAQTSDDDNPQDFLGIYAQYETLSSQKSWWVEEADAAALNGTGTRGIDDGIALRKYFLTFKRLSASKARLEVYADGARTILIESIDRTLAGNPQTLQYMKVLNRTVSGAGVMDLRITKVRVWDGITNPVTQETATYTEIGDWADQPTADGDWVSNDTAQARGNITNDNIDLIYNINSASNDAISHDLGFVLDDKFILQGKINYSTLTGGSNGGSIWMGVSSSDSGTGRADAQHFIGLQIRKDTDTLWSHDTDNAIIGATGDNSASITWAASTDYYWRIVKDGLSYTVSVYSDSGFSILLGEATGTLTSTADFQYIKFMNLMATNSGTAVATVDDINLWNGVTSPNATARKFVFTDNDLTETATEYSSETISYDPINGDLEVNVRIPTLTTGADTIIQMYHDYSPSANPSYSAKDWTINPTETTITEDVATSDITSWQADNDKNGVKVANTTSEFYGLFVSEVSFYLKKNGSPTGTALVRYHPPTLSDTNFVELGTITLSALTTGFVKTTFNSFTPFIWEEGGAVVIDINGNGDASNYLIIEGQATESYDGVNTHRVRTINDGAWSDLTTHDINIEVKYLSKGTKEQSTYDGNYKAVYHLQGNSLDSTVYGNDGTDTSVDWEQQNNSVGLLADGANTKINVGSDTSIDNIFDGGGHIETWINPKSDGEANNGFILHKRSTPSGWMLQVLSESAGFMKLRLYYDFSTTDGLFDTTDAVIPINELSHIEVFYNNSSVSNTPTFIINGIKYTVGNGLTVTTTPVGTRSTDVSETFTISNDPTAIRTFDGLIDEVKLSDKTRPSSVAITSYNAEKADSDMVTAASSVSQ